MFAVGGKLVAHRADHGGHAAEAVLLQKRLGIGHGAPCPVVKGNHAGLIRHGKAPLDPVQQVLHAHRLIAVALQPLQIPLQLLRRDDVRPPGGAAAGDVVVHDDGQRHRLLRLRAPRRQKRQHREAQRKKSELFFPHFDQPPHSSMRAFRRLRAEKMRKMRRVVFHGALGI